MINRCDHKVLTLAVGVPVALLCARAAMASIVIDSEADAQSYIDMTFAAHGCEMQMSAFEAQMHVDGIIPTEAERQIDIGVTKFIRQRRVFAALEGLFASGAICEDETNPTNAISKFGGCA